MRVLETFIVLLIATVAFLWVILAHSTPEEHARLYDAEGGEHAHRVAIGMGPGRDLQRQRVARAVRIVDLAILGLSLAFVGALLSLW